MNIASFTAFYPRKPDRLAPCVSPHKIKWLSKGPTPTLTVVDRTHDMKILRSCGVIGQEEESRGRCEESVDYNRVLEKGWRV